MSEVLLSGVKILLMVEIDVIHLKLLPRDCPWLGVRFAHFLNDAHPTVRTLVFSDHNSFLDLWPPGGARGLVISEGVGRYCCWLGCRYWKVVFSLI